MGTHREIIDRIVALLQTCVPAEKLTQAFWPAAGCVLAGLVLMFWGARVIRGLILLVWMGAGGYIGWLLAQHFAKPSALGIVGGAVVAALVGTALARLWIGALSGALAALVALSAYGFSQDIPTRFGEFTRSHRQPAPTANNEFPLGERGAATARVAESPLRMAYWFAADLYRRGDPLLWNTFTRVGGAALVGLIVGLIASRWAMIFWTSLAGLLVMTGGSLVLAAGQWPKWHEVVAANALPILAGMGLIWMAAMFAQWRGTRAGAAVVCKPADTVIRVTATPQSAA
jgi:MFS family permease